MRPATVLLVIVVLIGGLWIFNNTRLGVSIKCHLFGDTGACIEESLLGLAQPGSATPTPTEPPVGDTAPPAVTPGAAGAGPVVTCPATYGAGDTPGSPAVPAGATPPPGTDLIFYADNYDHVLAPGGWSCLAAVGADGSSDVTVTNPADSQAEIHLQTGGACVSCQLALICTLFPAAAQAQQEQYGQSCAPPTGEQQTTVSSTVVKFDDPAGTKGTGDPSGGGYEVVGAGIYAGSQGGAALLTCSLSADQQSDCDAVIADFLATYGGQ